MWESKTSFIFLVINKETLYLNVCKLNTFKNVLFSGSTTKCVAKGKDEVVGK